MEAGWDTDGETIRWRKDLTGLEEMEEVAANDRRYPRHHRPSLLSRADSSPAICLAIENIDHTRTKVKGPHTNGICERFHKTVLEEFYRMAASAVYGFAFLLPEVSDAAVREGKHLGVRRQLAPLTLGPGAPKLEVDQCE